ncbi:antigen 5 like allergen Cul n 1-like [Episyrphus balteatus]|uniref:antigen 5 like allergen Cul n 1-like n=1 Tax=Episyrphus balteatus TaxID=286459 RepID=UPI0024867117|nr:antigen 5 like allergen Cul n 1-like [Episyrphus balteatus]
MLLHLIIQSFFITLVLADDEKPDYCDPKWCPNQGKHIACKNDGSFGKKCTGKYWTENLDDYQELILDLHNNVRNKFALGKVPRFKSAARMPVLRWDKKMTEMAELNVKTCHFEHDECRSTDDFPYCGQNIYFAQTTYTNYTMEDFIKEAVELWFLEHKDCNMDVMDSFIVTDPQTGHFTTLMTDRNDRVGCGYMQSILQRRFRKPLITIIFSCNYPSTNIVGIPAYKSGEVASLCTKPHDIYKGLCFEKEDIDPNNFDWYFD